MRSCGYSKNLREIVAKRTLGKYWTNHWNNTNLQRPLYRTKEERQSQLKEDKGSWFRAMGATTTLMVPTTKDSTLAKRLRLTLASNPGPRGTSCKVVEIPGPALHTGIAVNNPFLPDSCRRSDCPLATTGVPCRGKCAKEGVLYQAVCTRCTQEEDEGGPNQYIGESSRTVHVRRQQHLADYRYCAKKHQTGRRQEDDPRTSFMWDHQLEAHGGDHSINPEADFAFNVVNSHKDPLTRQIAEAVKILLSMW